MTEQPVSRRTLLAVAGTALVAGCGSNSESDQSRPGTRFARNTGRSTATPTRTRAREESDGGVEIEIDTDTPTDTETRTERRDTETRTETPEPEDTETPTPSGSQVLTVARANLRDAVREFVSHGTSSQTLDSVTAASIDFDKQAVLDEVSAARDQFERAAESGDVSQQRIDEHRAFAVFVEWLAETQAEVIDCYENLQSVLEHVYAEELDEAGGDFAGFQNAVEEARDKLNGFTERTSEGDTSALDVVSRDEYAEKVDQFRMELDGFEALFDPIQRTIDGLEAFAEGVDAYTRSDYTTAESEFFSSHNDFELAHTPLTTMSPPPSISGTVDTFTDFTR
ncbi:MAG: hypothetical protein ABEI99_07230, partial [Halobaculum sp.]